MNRNRFDLGSLPRCGARTRSGAPCRRYGNKVNHRCKLHGGKSTGARTPEGNRAVAAAHKTHGRTRSRALKRLWSEVHGLAACLDAQYPDEGVSKRKQERIEFRAARFLSRKFGVTFPIDGEEG